MVQPYNLIKLGHCRGSVRLTGLSGELFSGAVGDDLACITSSRSELRKEDFIK